MIQVHVPATSANCCIGFDSLGMALDWWAKFQFEKSNTLTITGCPDEYADENNLVVQAFLKTCQYLKKEIPTFHLHIDSDIPFSERIRLFFDLCSCRNFSLRCLVSSKLE